MTDQIEERLRETYGSIEPSLPKESVMARLPKQFRPRSPLPRLLVATAALAACVIALVGFWPDTAVPTPPAPNAAVSGSSSSLIRSWSYRIHLGPFGKGRSPHGEIHGGLAVAGGADFKVARHPFMGSSWKGWPPIINSIWTSLFQG